MTTKTINLYTFDELTDKAKGTAREWYRDGLFSQGIWDGDATIEDAKQCFSLVGFDIERVPFSGFWSQGDGACFEGSWKASDVQPGKLVEHAPQDAELHRIAAEIERIAVLFPFASFTVENSGRYCHEHSTSFSVSIPTEDGDEIDTHERETAEKALIEASRDAMRWTYRALEADYEWQAADEQVDESILANGYTFDEDGKRID